MGLEVVRVSHGEILDLPRTLSTYAVPAGLAPVESIPHVSATSRRGSSIRGSLTVLMWTALGCREGELIIQIKSNKPSKEDLELPGWTPNYLSLDQLKDLVTDVADGNPWLLEYTRERSESPNADPGPAWDGYYGYPRLCQTSKDCSTSFDCLATILRDALIVYGTKLSSSIGTCLPSD